MRIGENAHVGDAVFERRQDAFEKLHKAFEEVEPCGRAGSVAIEHVLVAVQLGQVAANIREPLAPDAHRRDFRRRATVAEEAHAQAQVPPAQLAQLHAGALHQRAEEAHPLRLRRAVEQPGAVRQLARNREPVAARHFGRQVGCGRRVAEPVRMPVRIGRSDGLVIGGKLHQHAAGGRNHRLDVEAMPAQVERAAVERPAVRAAVGDEGTPCERYQWPAETRRACVADWRTRWRERQMRRPRLRRDETAAGCVGTRVAQADRLQHAVGVGLQTGVCGVGEYFGQVGDAQRHVRLVEPGQRVRVGGAGEHRRGLDRSTVRRDQHQRERAVAAPAGDGQPTDGARGERDWPQHGR